MFLKFLNLIKSYQRDIFLAICIVLISFISFNLGKINALKKGSIKISDGANVYQASNSESAVNQTMPTVSSVPATPKPTPKPLDLRVVASKASTAKKYHYVWCNSWKRITLANQIWFASDKEAETKGYTLAGNCTK